MRILWILANCETSCPESDDNRNRDWGWREEGVLLRIRTPWPFLFLTLYHAKQLVTKESWIWLPHCKVAFLSWWVWPGCTSIYYTIPWVQKLWLPITLTTVGAGGNTRWTQPKRPCLSDLPVPLKIRKLLWSEATERLFLLFNCHQFISPSSH